MLNKCANPHCPAAFHYFRDGQIFHVERESDGDASKPSHNVEHFWLCGACSQTMTVRFDPGKDCELFPGISGEQRSWPATHVFQANRRRTSGSKN